MADLVKITVDESTFTVEKGTTLSDFFSSQQMEKTPLFVKINGQLKDLETRVDKDMDVQSIYEDNDDALDILRHSAAHLMAHAVLDLFPGTKTGIGPAVENGFYYDFLRDEPFTQEDLDKIETRMRELSREDIPIERTFLSKDDAIKKFKSMGQDLKVELIQEKGDDTVSTYGQDDFLDFCLGPHVPSTGYIRHFKLLSVSGAYWKGDEKGKQLQRIYGVAFFTREELDDFLAMMDEAKQYDHRKLGPEMDLFSFN
jgi:threonyl-tRNA synthetase